MAIESSRDSAWRRMRRIWISSLGVQSWLMEALRHQIASKALYIAEALEPESLQRSETKQPGIQPAAPVSSFLLNSYPRTPESVRALIDHVRETLLRLDDVKDYSLIDDVDNDMYQLWKELERKMQSHRRSEAKFQLKDMFRI